MSKYNPLIEYLHDLPNDIYNEVVKLLIKEILRKQKDDNDLILFMNDIDVNEFILFNDIIEFKNYLNEYVGIVIEYKKDKRIEINLRDYYTIKLNYDGSQTYGYLFFENINDYQKMMVYLNSRI